MRAPDSTQIGEGTLQGLYRYSRRLKTDDNQFQDFYCSFKAYTIEPYFVFLLDF